MPNSGSEQLVAYAFPDGDDARREPGKRAFRVNNRSRLGRREVTVQKVAMEGMYTSGDPAHEGGHSTEDSGLRRVRVNDVRPKSPNLGSNGLESPGVVEGL
jgi:hypothetical protein